MTEQMATIEDWREIGALFGHECAMAAKRLVADGKSPQQINEHVRGMIAVKDVCLRQIGGDDVEISAFIDAAGKTAARSVLIAEVFSGLNRRSRRKFESTRKKRSF